MQFGVEGDLEDGGSGFEFSGGVLEVFDVPDVQFLVFSSGSDVFSVGGNGDSVDVGVVGLEGVLDLDVGVPDFESSVPSYRGKEGGGVSFGGFHDGGVSDTRDPVGVVVGIGFEFKLS